MNNPDNFGANLRLLKEERNLSLTEFSKELQIPRTTLQAVLENGQTSLDTACRISDALKIPLSALTDIRLSGEKLEILKGLFLGMEWYSGLAPEQQEIAARSFMEFMGVFLA